MGHAVFPLYPGRNGKLCSTSSVVAFSGSLYFAIRINEPINAAATTITGNMPAIDNLAEWILDIKWPSDLASVWLCPTQRLGPVADLRLSLADR